MYQKLLNFQTSAPFWIQDSRQSIWKIQKVPTLEELTSEAAAVADKKEPPTREDEETPPPKKPKGLAAILEKRPKKNPVELLISKRRKKSYLIVTSHQIQAVIPQIDGSKTVTDSHCFQYQSEYTCVPWNQRAIGMCIQFWWIHCRSTPCQITAKQYEHANIAVKEHAMIVCVLCNFLLYIHSVVKDWMQFWCDSHPSGWDSHQNCIQSLTTLCIYSKKLHSTQSWHVL